MKLKLNYPAYFFLVMVIFVLLNPLFITAQHTSPRPEKDARENRGFQFGFNIGLFLPNGYTANYYNGSDGNENNIRYIFGNYYNYQDIRRLLNVSDTFFVKQFPADMHYRPTTIAGFYMGYNFNRKNSMYIQFNYSKLKPRDIFTVEVDPKDYLTEPDLRLYTVSGEEERINIDIGYSRSYPVTDHMDFVASAGLALNDTKVLKAVINLEGKEYSIVNVYGNRSYVPGTNMQEYQFTEGGIGFGLHGGAGVNFNFANKFALQPGVTLYWNNVNLEGYKAMKISSCFFLRIIALNIL